MGTLTRNLSALKPLASCGGQKTLKGQIATYTAHQLFCLQWGHYNKVGGVESFQSTAPARVSFIQWTLSKYSLMIDDGYDAFFFQSGKNLTLAYEAN